MISKDMNNLFSLLLEKEDREDKEEREEREEREDREEHNHTNTNIDDFNLLNDEYCIDEEEISNDIIFDDNITKYNYDSTNEYKKYEFDNNNYKKQVWKKRENIYCNNCGKYGHIYKKCFEPITSYGIICLNLNNNKIYDFFLAKYKFPNDSQILKNICINKYIQKNISCNNRKDLDIFERKIITNTNYLMVRRKHTYNYIHIIRGLYDIEIEGIIKSINLLTYKEYQNILTMTFDELWTDIWEENTIKIGYNNDYIRSKKQFDFLILYIIPQIKHKIKIIYNIPEWGFPKGKRSNNESNIECARREFEEESGLSQNDYELLDRLYPLNENIKGSNGINYKHVYFIAILKPTYDVSKLKIYDQTQFFEIGDIGLYNIEEIQNIIRNYNKERLDIVNNIKLFLTYNTRYFEKFYHDNKLN